MYKNRKKIMAVFITVLMFSLAACGKDAEESTSVDTETTEETSEEISTEEESAVPYVEDNGLKFTDETKVSTKGTLCIGNDTDNADIIDADWEIVNISINTEDDVKTITIEQNVYGYIWSDGKNIFKTNLNLPSAMLCDIYTGKIIPLTEESTTTEIEWGEEKFSIETIETESWEDGDWSTDWVEDANGGERLSSTLKVIDTIKVTKDYDGLALVLIPITDANGSNVGNYIKDIWTDESYLFNVNDMSANFAADAEEEVEETETSVDASSEEESKEDAKTEEPKSAETTAPKEETKPTHTHSYNSGVVTTQPTCTTNGVKTYTCSGCGNTYTESLGTAAHNYSIPITQIVHHDEVWNTVPRTVKVKVARCSCGAEFTSNDEFHAHRTANIEAEGAFSACAGATGIYETTQTIYDYVKVSDAYDEQVTVGYKCSICGATQ